MTINRVGGLATGMFTCALLTSWLAIGCGGPKVLPEYPVKGTVTLDGSPMADGEIYFRDEATATNSTLTVKNGQFEGKSEAGKFKVQVNCYREETAKADSTGYAPPGGATKKNIVLPEFAADSKLTAEVTAAGPNEYKFEVKSK